MSDEWIHLVAYGSVAGFDFNEAAVASMVRNFKGRVPLDEEVLLGLPPPPLAWIDRVEQRADGLWGHAEWAKRAQPFPPRQSVYASAAVRVNVRDKVTGERIGCVLVAATPTPYPLGKVARMEGPKA